MFRCYGVGGRWHHTPHPLHPPNVVPPDQLRVQQRRGPKASSSSCPSSPPPRQASSSRTWTCPPTSSPPVGHHRPPHRARQGPRKAKAQRRVVSRRDPTSLARRAAALHDGMSMAPTPTSTLGPPIGCRAAKPSEGEAQLGETCPVRPCSERQSSFGSQSCGVTGYRCTAVPWAVPCAVPWAVPGRVGRGDARSQAGSQAARPEPDPTGSAL